ncbi:hypothetical protein ZIOFF_071774 [Zingiber officinale]|uniref:Disease resistance N-terminal domain-containing protein n=1 Tax=Zingiber officinale TaxID=94328 RepID=A0A8J5CA20_ZINOF|nr:hypothetical protein ZIOFF_071774 [Zingiber officinale]
MDCIDKLLPESGIIWSILIAVYTKFSLIQGLEDAVDKLQRTHNSIQCLLIDAEALDIVNEAVKGWVCEMKTAAFDAENLIDEFQTLVDITKHAEAPSRRRKRSIPYLGGFMTLVKRRRIADDIAKIEDRLDEIRKSRMNLGLEPSDGQRRSYGSNEMVCFPTSANFDESRIFRRTKECDSVVAALKAKSVSNLRIVVIHGLPGIGMSFIVRVSRDGNPIIFSKFLNFFIPSICKCLSLGSCPSSGKNSHSSEQDSLTISILEKQVSASQSENSLPG